MIIFLISSWCNNIAGAITNIFTWRKEHTLLWILLSLIILAIDRTYLLDAWLRTQINIALRTIVTGPGWIIWVLTVLRSLTSQLSIKIMNMWLSLWSSIILACRWFTKWWQWTILARSRCKLPLLRITSLKASIDHILISIFICETAFVLPLTGPSSCVRSEYF